jgi:hypothetical protein
LMAACTAASAASTGALSVTYLALSAVRVA